MLHAGLLYTHLPFRWTPDGKAIYRRKGAIECGRIEKKRSWAKELWPRNQGHQMIERKETFVYRQFQIASPGRNWTGKKEKEDSTKRRADCNVSQYTIIQCWAYIFMVRVKRKRRHSYNRIHVQNGLPLLLFAWLRSTSVDYSDRVLMVAINWVAVSSTWSPHSLFVTYIRFFLTECCIDCSTELSLIGVCMGRKKVSYKTF